MKQVMKSRKIKPDDNTSKKNQKNNNLVLILHNDDINSFDYVIQSLTDVCNHDYEQAVQCTLLTHYKGTCDIYRGKPKILKRMQKELFNKNLKVTIETAL